MSKKTLLHPGLISNAPQGKSIPISPSHGVNPSMMQCFWCGETKGIALLGKLPNDAEAPRMAIFDYEPCDSCAALMAQGITLMEADEHTHKPTGSYMVIKEEALNNLLIDGELKTSILKMRKCFVPSNIYATLYAKEEQPNGESET